MVDFNSKAWLFMYLVSNCSMICWQLICISYVFEKEMVYLADWYTYNVRTPHASNTNHGSIIVRISIPKLEPVAIIVDLHKTIIEWNFCNFLFLIFEKSVIVLLLFLLTITEKWWFSWRYSAKIRVHLCFAL